MIDAIGPIGVAIIICLCLLLSWRYDWCHC